MLGALLRSAAITALVVASASAGVAQSADSFAVASIKRNTSGLPYGQSADRPDGLALVNETLRDVILFAFDVHDFQLVGAPAWIARERFDIAARADGPLSVDDKRARLRRLLADRFGLRAATETREQPVYALQRIAGAASAGLKPRDCAVPGVGALPCGRGLTVADAGMMRMGGIPMTQVARLLTGVLHRTVTDATGLGGLFDVDLQWRPDLEISPDLTDEARARIQERPALPSALREQLGLDLQPGRGPVKLVLVAAINEPALD